MHTNSKAAAFITLDYNIRLLSASILRRQNGMHFPNQSVDHLTGGVGGIWKSALVNLVVLLLEDGPGVAVVLSLLAVIVVALSLIHI